jgi:hypothetical protein
VTTIGICVAVVATIMTVSVTAYGCTSSASSSTNSTISTNRNICRSGVAGGGKANAWFAVSPTTIIAANIAAIKTDVFLYIFRQEEFRITYLIKDSIDIFASSLCKIFLVLPSMITISQLLFWIKLQNVQYILRLLYFICIPKASSI